MKKIKIGVFGAGNMGKNHIRILKDLTNEFELVGFAESNEETAKIVEQSFNVKHYSSIDELLDRVDAVSIVLPTSFHYEYAEKCIAMNKHLLIEKPITMVSEEGKKLVESSEDKGLILQVGHVERYNPAISELASILQNEQILAMDFQRLSPFDKRIFDADVVQDLMIHDIDLMNSLANSKIIEIMATGKNVYSPKQMDYAQALIKFDNGVLCSLTASRITEDKVRLLTITTKYSYIYVDMLARNIKISRRTNFHLNTVHEITYRQENIIEKVYIPMYEPLRKELQDFAEAIETHKIPKVSGRDGLKAVEITEYICRLLYR